MTLTEQDRKLMRLLDAIDATLADIHRRLDHTGGPRVGEDRP